MTIVVICSIVLSLLSVILSLCSFFLVFKFTKQSTKSAEDIINSFSAFGSDELFNQMLGGVSGEDSQV